MSTAGDDVTDPLAGIDLNAWQPPAAGAAPVDAILARAVDGTRVDGRAAVEIETDAPVRRPRAPRTRWLAIGFTIGVAAAALVAIALWPLDTTRTVTVAVPTPAPIPMPFTPSKPAGTVGPTLAQCKAFGDSSDWDGMIACAQSMPADDPDAKQLIDVAHQAQADAEHKRIADEQANKDRQDYDFTGCDWSKAVKLAKYAKKDNAWDRMLAKAQEAEKCKSTATGRQLSLYAACKLGDREVAMKYWSEFVDDEKLYDICTDVTHAPTSDCDATALLDEARQAGSADQWNKVLAKGEASNKCAPSKIARQFALLAACHLGNRDKALKYWKEFETSSSMQQVCIGVVSETDSAPETCDANALLDEARDAGSANQWSKVLAKSEASNMCSPSKIARQLALLAACQLGNKDKALKYWKEFENNTGMQERCIGVVK